MNPVLGVALAIPAAACFGVGAALQKRRAVALPPPSGSPWAFARAFLTDRRWLAASGVVLAGWGFEIPALRLAPIALVLPVALSGIALVGALSARWLDERLSTPEWAGVVLTLVGVMLAGISAQEGAALAGPAAGLSVPALWIAVVALVGAGGLAVLVGNRGKAGGVVLAAGAGILFTATGLLSKALAVAEGGPAFGLLLHCAFLVVPLVAVSIAASLVLQAAFQRSRAVVAVAWSGAISSFLPAAMGGIVFGEAWPDGTPGLLRWLGLGAMLLGFTLLRRPAAALSSG